MVCVAMVVRYSSPAVPGGSETSGANSSGWKVTLSRRCSCSLALRGTVKPEGSTSPPAAGELRLTSWPRTMMYTTCRPLLSDRAVTLMLFSEILEAPLVLGVLRPHGPCPSCPSCPSTPPPSFHAPMCHACVLACPPTCLLQNSACSKKIRIDHKEVCLV
jgi:hypothetical protein